jgi:hypothetical protein
MRLNKPNTIVPSHHFPYLVTGLKGYVRLLFKTKSTSYPVSPPYHSPLNAERGERKHAPKPFSTVNKISHHFKICGIFNLVEAITWTTSGIVCGAVAEVRV